MTPGVLLPRASLRQTGSWWALLAVSCVGPQVTLAQRAYLDYSTFEAWRALVPEVPGARVCGLTIAGHQLWAAGQLRMPLDRFVHGDFRASGSQDWAVELSAHGNDRQCQFLLVVTQEAAAWRRLLLERVDPEVGAQGFTVVWSPQVGALGVDFGQRKRLTAPATMTCNGSECRAESGLVIERLLIRHRCSWNQSTGRFNCSRLAVPEEWDSPSSPKDMAMTTGESWQRVYRGRLASVLADRSLYAADDTAVALVRIRIINRSPRRLGVDLSDYWNVVYPNQWSVSPAPRRLVIDEREAYPRALDAPAEARLRMGYQDQSLVMVDSHGSVDYFREFNGKRPADSDGGGVYLIVSLSGQLWVTDGQEAEGITLLGAPPDKRDVILPFPLRWQPIPLNARVVRHP